MRDHGEHARRHPDEGDDPDDDAHHRERTDIPAFFSGPVLLASFQARLLLASFQARLTRPSQFRLSQLSCCQPRLGRLSSSRVSLGRPGVRGVWRRVCVLYLS